MYLDSLNADELSRDVSIEFNREFYPVVRYPYFVNAEQCDVFDEGQLILKVDLYE
tara:strand:+ start:66 stop:230 length:165 start_codon:yes stop_codon:yes gene_type:complete